jgi:hypothetical protein
MSEEREAPPPPSTAGTPPAPVTPSTTPAPVTPSTTKRLVRFGVLMAALAIFLVLSRGWPKDRVMHFSLGDSAPRVEELRVGYSEAGDEFTRGATFHFALGTAPRIVTHEVRLAEGDYTIEIEVASRASAAGGYAQPAQPAQTEQSEQRSTVKRRVHVDQDSVSIDVSKVVPR